MIAKYAATPEQVAPLEGGQKPRLYACYPAYRVSSESVILYFDNFPEVSQILSYICMLESCHDIALPNYYNEGKVFRLA